MAYYGFCKEFKPGIFPENSEEKTGFADWPADVHERIRRITLEYLQEYSAMSEMKNEDEYRAPASTKEEGHCKTAIENNK